MRYVTLITIATSIMLFTGCGDNNFDKSIKDDILTSTEKWYEIDSTRELYQTFEFDENTLTKYIYNDKYFNELIDIKKFNIQFVDDDKFNIVEDGVSYSCKVDTCNNNQFVMVSCNANETGVKELIYCGWNSQDKAKANMQ